MRRNYFTLRKKQEIDCEKSGKVAERIGEVRKRKPAVVEIGESDAVYFTVSAAVGQWFW